MKVASSGRDYLTRNALAAEVVYPLAPIGSSEICTEVQHGRFGGAFSESRVILE